MTYLAVSIMVQSVDQALAATARAAEEGAELVEFRIDRFTNDRQSLRQLIELAILPCVLTCRPVWECGHYEGPDEDRIDVLEYGAFGLRKPAYVDVELATYLRSAEVRQQVGRVVDHLSQAQSTTTGVILSSHDAQTRPVDLYQRIEAMTAAAACRVIKIVWQARSLRDNLEAFEILLQRHKPTIVLCMGEVGLASRVLAKKFGALLTFASLESGAETAPGQPSVGQLKNLYRWDKIDAETHVYGVIGYPVAHSKSPAIHNAGFDAIDHNAVYLPMPIPPEYEHFKATVGAWLAMPALHFCGASVTIPHKENLIRFVSESGGQVEQLAARIGAANTLTVRNDGSLYASNTDYAAAIDVVCERLECERQALKGKRVAVIGAGGVARAVVAGFAHYGATVVVYNRTIDRAKVLADQFNESVGKVVAAPIAKLCDSCCQIYINCTSVGMHPNVDASPIDLGKPNKGWGPGTVVFDTIYNPPETLLLRQARQDGCSVIPGIEMFARQAADQFTLWTNKDAPTDVFRRALGI